MNRKEIKKGRHSQESLLGISLLYVVRKIRKIFYFIKDRKAGDPRYQHSGMTASCGFTLIELLVVVLIIGILAAVALPQYQKAVEKSKSVELFVNLSAIVRAAESVYLETGNYPTDFNTLPVSLQGELSDNAGYENSILTTPSGKKYFLEVFNNNGISAVQYSPYMQLNYFVRGVNKGKMYCRAAKNDKLVNDLCKNRGGTFDKQEHDENWYWIE